MGKLVTIGVRIPEEFVKGLEESAKEENIDKRGIQIPLFVRGLEKGDKSPWIY